MDDRFKAWLLDDDVAVAIHRLASLAASSSGGSLLHSLPEVENAKFTKNAVTGRVQDNAYGFGYPRRERSVTVQVQEAAPGRYRLAARCDGCYSSTNCRHALSAVMHAVSLERPDIGAILQSPQALQSLLLSDYGADFLNTLEHSEAAADLESSSSPEIGARVLLYVLDLPEAGCSRTLRVESRSILKDGSKSVRGTNYRWSSLQQLWVTAPAPSAFAAYRADRDTDDGPEDGIASADDVRIAKQIFVDAALPASHVLEVVGARLGDSLELMAATGRLYVAQALDRPLKLAAHRSARWSWQRNSVDLWQLQAAIDGDGFVLPCDPPWYVDPVEGVVGPLIGRWNRTSLVAAVKARSLSDQDLELLRKHAGDRLTAQGLPILPRVETVHAGVLRPRPIARLTWAFDDPNYEPPAVSSPRSGGGRGRRDMGEAALRLEFDYDGAVVTSPDGFEVSRPRGTQRIVYQRDRDFEQSCLARVALQPLIKESDGFTVLIGRGCYSTDSLMRRLQTYHETVVPALHQAGWTVFMNEAWPFAQRDVLAFDYDVDEDNPGTEEPGWLGFGVAATVDGRPIDMARALVALLARREVLASLAESNTADDEQRSWTVQEANGYRLAIPVALLRQLLPLITGLHVDDQGRSRVRRMDFGAVEVARQGTDSRLMGGDTLVALATALRDVPAELPAATRTALKGAARPYQIHGANWCDVRRRHGFGGIVGDEYAAGKTLQGLLTLFSAFHEPEAVHRTSLIVVTKTLFFEGRWQEDAERFLPSMRLLCIAGSAQIAQLAAHVGHHAVLTTYDAIVANLEAFQALPWNVIACDEGHKLGNSSTHKARAIDSLTARQKLVVTGSPMQNSPRELWSVMNIAVPGLLRHKAWFDRTFPKARVVAGTDPSQMKEVDTETRRANAARLSALGKLIAPFYLRRTNDELGRSLPMINDVLRTVVMDEAQAQAYEAVRASGQEQVQSLIAQAGFEPSKQQIIVAINRLRQVCADPRLIQRGARAQDNTPSAKLQALLDICRELADEGKKVVVVSEWTEMLKLIRASLADEGLLCDLLHGELTGPARQRVSAGFRIGATQVLLIQLQLAEGIELPEGDAIILYEPWWNTKREEQAIARLRRDERNKHVTVVRLVIPGSVEIGVQRVAQAKLADIEAVLQGHASEHGGGLSREDVDAIFAPAARFS